MQSFNALMVDKTDDGSLHAHIRQITPDALPAGDVLVSINYSSINYKDGLAITGKGNIFRSFPMVPGVDFVGTVVESASAHYTPGDVVILTGWGVGERYWGGYAQIARVKSEWLVPLPEGINPQQAMSIGTAGFTAMLCLIALEAHGMTPKNGREIVVTGASGGVGSFAVSLLAQRGYRVVASTGREENHAYLHKLGASDIIARSVLAATSPKPLESERWGGAIDTVGGTTLASILRSMAYGASVAACGLTGGSDLPATVFPFILRGVNLLGIDSVMCPLPQRNDVWHRLARDVAFDQLDLITEVIPLQNVVERAHDIVQGTVRGRIVVDVNA